MRGWLFTLLSAACFAPGFVRAERAVILPLRSEVELTAQQLDVVRTAQEDAVGTQGLEHVTVAGAAPCTEPSCVAARIAEAAAQHAFELTVWRSESGRISGVSVSVFTQSGARFSEGAQVARDDDLGSAIARATQGAYVRMRRGPGPWLQLVGTPEGATISIDGDAAGTLPQRSKVRGGLHRVRVSLDGFEAFETTVTVPRNTDALKQLSIALRVATSGATARTKQVPESRAWSYALAGIGVAASAVLAIGPLRSAAEDGDCGRLEQGACTAVVDFDGGQGLQLAAAALLLGAGVAVAIWAPL